jgi:hypothetical protein
MDPSRFEQLSRRVGAADTRRAAIKTVAAALTAPLLVSLRGEEAEAGIPIFGCRVPGKKCSKDQKCCSGSCKKGRCSCKKKGRTCWAPLEGELCCSRKCKSGKCG